MPTQFSNSDVLKARFSQNLIEAGIDEAGRGCLAGPVFAAAVILPFGYSNSELNDSKKLSLDKRMKLREEILQSAQFYYIATSSQEEIDRLNILQATYLAMHRAIDGLNQIPELLLIDGNRFKPYKNIDYKCIVKGDSLFQSIAAASILAKTERDLYMQKIHSEFPQYHWDQNKGYGTRKHVAAIDEFGLSPHHRKSFHLKNQLKLDI